MHRLTAQALPQHKSAYRKLLFTRIFIFYKMLLRMRRTYNITTLGIRIIYFYAYIHIVEIGVKLRVNTLRRLKFLML